MASIFTVILTTIIFSLFPQSYAMNENCAGPGEPCDPYSGYQYNQCCSYPPMTCNGEMCEKIQTTYTTVPQEHSGPDENTQLLLANWMSTAGHESNNLAGFRSMQDFYGGSSSAMPVHQPPSFPMVSANAAVAPRPAAVARVAPPPNIGKMAPPPPPAKMKKEKSKKSLFSKLVSGK